MCRKARGPSPSRVPPKRLDDRGGIARLAIKRHGTASLRKCQVPMGEFPRRGERVTIEYSPVRETT